MTSDNAESQYYERVWARKGQLWRRDDGSVEEGETYAGGLERVDQATKLLDAGGRLLDVGCGDGNLAMAASSKFDEVHGIELSPLALEVAMIRTGLIGKVANVNVEALPYVDSFFDAVTCIDVIEHVFEPQDLISEIRRVLRPGGHAVISTPNIRYHKYIRSLTIGGRFPKTAGDLDLGYDGGHLHYFTRTDLVSLANEAGLQVVVARGYAVFPGSRGARILRRFPSSGLFQEFLADGIIVKARKW